MRRLILIFFVFLILGVVLALVFREDVGYVQIAFAGWRLETSLLFAGAFAVAALWLLLTLWRLIVAALLAPRTARHWWQGHKAQKQRQRFTKGLQYLAEGRWQRAEQLLSKEAPLLDIPNLNLLFAAQAAQQNQSPSQRDLYLQQAKQVPEISQSAVFLTRVRLLIQQGDYALAEQALLSKGRQYSNNAQALELMAEVFVATKNYAQLRELLPKLYRQSKINPVIIDRWAVQAWQEVLEQHKQQYAVLEHHWQEVPRNIQSLPKLKQIYAACLHEVEQDKKAEKQCIAILKAGWNEAAALLYGELKPDERQALNQVEKWLAKYGQKPTLQYLAGIVCLRNQLHGRAEQYFKDCAGNNPSPAVREKLAEVYEQAGEHQQALKLFWSPAE